MKTLVSAAAVAAIAGSAFGLGETLDRSNYPIYSNDTPGVTVTATRMGSTERTTLHGSGTAVYGWDDSEPFPTNGQGLGFLASGYVSGNLGYEDYGSTLSTPPNGTPATQHDVMKTTVYQFWGNVQSTGLPILFMDFYFNDNSYANGFGVSFGATNPNYLYLFTITLTGPPSFLAPTEGYHRIFANTDPNIANAGAVTTGFWALSNEGANPLNGTNDLAWDSGNHQYTTGTGTTETVIGTYDIGYLFALAVPTPATTALMGLAGLAGVSRRRRR